MASHSRSASGRGVLLALFVAGAAASARAQDVIDKPSTATPEQRRQLDAAENRLWSTALLLTVLAPFSPYLLVGDKDDQLFQRHPYEDPGKDYAAGDRDRAFRASMTGLYVPGRDWAGHAWARIRLASRSGVEAEYGRLEPPEFASRVPTDLIGANLTASLLESPSSLLDLVWGFATIQNDDTKWGGAAGLAWEAYPRAPLFVGARYDARLMSDGRFYHHLKAEAGLTWRGIGASIGARAYLNPLRSSAGPEAALHVWF